MILNSDDTEQEQFINAMHTDKDSLVNCEKCSRLFYINTKIGKERLSCKSPILCLRCRDK